MDALRCAILTVVRLAAWMMLLETRSRDGRDGFDRSRDGDYLMNSAPCYWLVLGAALVTLKLRLMENERGSRRNM